MTLPNWVKKHRKPRQEIKSIGGRYYVYEVSSAWDPDSKRTRKISGKLLGKITKEGGFESREKYGIKSHTVKAPLTSKEWGVVNLITSLMKDTVSQLEKIFPEEWQQIIVTAYSRLLHQSPLKNISLHFEHSYLSNLYPECSVRSKVIGQMIQSLGTKREQIRKYFKATSAVASGNECMLIDGTHILNRSAANMSEIGYNSQGNYSPQANLLYIFAKDSNAPIYYRLTPGNVREVKSFKISLKESGLENATVIADKGFYSKSNIQELEDNLINYIIPLQRSSSLVNYDIVAPLDKKKLSGYFIFAGRTIWYHCQGKVTLFLDEELRLAEERDYLKRIETHPEEYSIEGFHSKSHTFGTLAILTNLIGSTPQETYSQYKSRGAIEQLFDSLKNLLHADRTYMRTDEGLEGWMFVNHIALTWYYRIYSALLAADVLSKFSVNDVLLRAAKIHKIRINDTWFTTEITTKTQKLLSDIGCPVT
jgi:transposase